MRNSKESLAVNCRRSVKLIEIYDRAEQRKIYKSLSCDYNSLTRAANSRSGRRLSSVILHLVTGLKARELTVAGAVQYPFRSKIINQYSNALALGALLLYNLIALSIVLGKERTSATLELLC